jgi:BirA family biotin operon repressor/biotin-[acetyl-CoA-carboxylase] ligase
VVGLGINVDQGREELPVETATSLRLAGAPEVSRERLVEAVLRHLAGLHAALVRGGADRAEAQAAYRAACLTVGREIDLHSADGTVSRVTATGIDATGRLVVSSRGQEYAVAAGDVVHAKAAPGG